MRCDTRLLAATLAAALAFAASASSQISVERAWVRAMPPGARVGGGYLTIHNRSAVGDRLVGASSPAAERVELHEHLREGQVIRMRAVSGFDVPANGRFELKPGGAHLMFVSVRRPFAEGARIPVKLTFEKAGEVAVEFHVGRLGGSAAPGR